MSAIQSQREHASVCNSKITWSILKVLPKISYFVEKTTHKTLCPHKKTTFLQQIKDARPMLMVDPALDS